MSCSCVKALDDYQHGVDETLQSLVKLEGSGDDGEEEEGEGRDREGEKEEEEEREEGEVGEGKGEERERVGMVLRKAKEAVKECQELLHTGQGKREKHVTSIYAAHTVSTT